MIKNPPERPSQARPLRESYVDAPPPKRLGIKPGCTVSLVGAPPGFRQTLGELPENVVLRDGVRGEANLTLWFAKYRRELEERMLHMRRFSKNSGLRVIWPKQASKIQTDLAQPLVREAGLAAGMADFKICSIDETWSGLRFSLKEK